MESGVEDCHIRYITAENVRLTVVYVPGSGLKGASTATSRCVVESRCTAEYGYVRSTPALCVQTIGGQFQSSDRDDRHHLHLRQ